MFQTFYVDQLGWFEFCKVPLYFSILQASQSMSHLDDLSRTFEAMSMSSIVTDIATPPPPPPPLELERWRTMSKTMSTKRNGFFTRHFDFRNDEKSRGGEDRELSRFSRESSVASDISETSLKSNFSSVSRSSTLSRLFSRKKKKSREYTRSASSDSLSENWRRGWSTPATPVPYGTWRRGRSTSATPSLSLKLKSAIEGKQRVGKFNIVKYLLAVRILKIFQVKQNEITCLRAVGIIRLIKCKAKKSIKSRRCATLAH